jgi:hypothetical protein
VQAGVVSGKDMAGARKATLKAALADVGVNFAAAMFDGHVLIHYLLWEMGHQAGLRKDLITALKDLRVESKTALSRQDLSQLGGEVQKRLNE